MFGRIGKLVILGICFAAGLLAACDGPGGETEMIRPGDRIGEAVLRKAVDQSEMEPVLYHHCQMQLAEIDKQMREECLLATEPYYFLGFGIGDVNMEELDAIWESLDWDIALNGTPIDLDAFGTIDGSDSRFWNIVLENPGDGPYEFEEGFTTKEDPPEFYALTLNLIFAEPEEVALANNADDSLPEVTADIVPGQHSFYSVKADRDYLLYVPESYQSGAEGSWPLIMYLHGAGPRYSLDVIREYALPQKLAGEDNFPFIVVSPRAFRGDYEFWAAGQTAKSVATLLDELKETLEVDPDRIYLVGESAGGNGVWELGLRYPDRFAALVPVMGYYGWPFTVPENICDLKHVPVWAFHGALDKTIPLDAQQQIVDALRDCGGDVEFTIFPDQGHNIEGEAYNTSELYEWLLAQSLD